MYIPFWVLFLVLYITFTCGIFLPSAWKTFLRSSCSARYAGNESSHLLSVKKLFYFIFIFGKNSRSRQHSNKVILLSYVFHCSDSKSAVIFIFITSIMCHFPLWVLLRFCLYHWLSATWLRCALLCFFFFFSMYSSWSCLSFLDLWIYGFHQIWNLKKVQPLFLYPLVLQLYMC